MIPVRIWAPVVLVLFGVGWFAIWLHGDRARERERGAAQARIERDSALVVSYRDSLSDARAGTTASIVKVDTLIRTFDRVRTQVVRIPGTDTVKVPVRVIEAADSLRQACGLLMENCDRFKLFADSTMAAQARIIANQNVRFEKKPSGRRYGIGVFTGICEDKKPCVGAGVVVRIL